MIVIIGDSHTIALRNATSIKGEDTRVHWLNFGRGASAKFGDLTLDEGKELVQSLGTNDLLVLSLGGNAHNIFGLLRHERAFDVHAESQDVLELDTQTECIPYNLLREHFEKIFLSNKVLIDYIETMTGTCAFLAPPPPKNADAKLIEKAKRYNGVQLDEFTLNPAARRLRLWKASVNASKHVISSMGGGSFSHQRRPSRPKAI
jgi:hypothetical protein